MSLFGIFLLLCPPPPGLPESGSGMSDEPLVPEALSRMTNQLLSDWQAALPCLNTDLRSVQESDHVLYFIQVSILLMHLCSYEYIYIV